MAATSSFPIGIGELSKQTGCKIETIRYYEQQTLMPEPSRTDGGHRLYSQEMRGRLLFIRRSRELGFSMNEIRGLLSLVDGEQVSCERVKTIAEDHLRDIREKITDLRQAAILTTGKVRPISIERRALSDPAFLVFAARRTETCPSSQVCWPFEGPRRYGTGNDLVV